MPVLGNPRHERVAQLLAAGCSAEDASAQAGFNAAASSFAANARKRAQRPDIRERRKELQGQVADKIIEVTAEWLQRNVAVIAGVKPEADDIKPSDIIAANKLLAQMIGALAPEKHDVTFSDLGKRLDDAIRRAGKDDGKA